MEHALTAFLPLLHLSRFPSTIPDHHFAEYLLGHVACFSLGWSRDLGETWYRCYSEMMISVSVIGLLRAACNSSVFEAKNWPCRQTLDSGSSM